MVDRQQTLLRRQLARTLAPEIADRQPASPMLLDTLTTVSGWRHWVTLRCDSGHSAAQAEQAVVFALMRILG